MIYSPRNPSYASSPYISKPNSKAILRKGAEQKSVLEEITRAVPTRSFKMLLAVVCLGRFVFGNKPTGEVITARIQFIRLVDICLVTSIEEVMAEQIKRMIVADAPRRRYETECWNYNANTHLITLSTFNGRHIFLVDILCAGSWMRRRSRDTFCSTNRSFSKKHKIFQPLQ